MNAESHFRPLPGWVADNKKQMCQRIDSLPRRLKQDFDVSKEGRLRLELEERPSLETSKCCLSPR